MGAVLAEEAHNQIVECHKGSVEAACRKGFVEAECHIPNRDPLHHQQVVVVLVLDLALDPKP